MLSESLNSSSTLMNEQPSKSSRWNHSPNTSKMASRRSAPPSARRITSATSHSRVQRSARASRKASTSSSLDWKLRYRLILATPESATIRSTPMARTPCRLNSS